MEGMRHLGRGCGRIGPFDRFEKSHGRRCRPGSAPSGPETPHRGAFDAGSIRFRRVFRPDLQVFSVLKDKVARGRLLAIRLPPVRIAPSVARCLRQKTIPAAQNAQRCHDEEHEGRVMFALGGILLLMAIGFAASGMVTDGGGDMPEPEGGGADDGADAPDDPDGLGRIEGAALSDLLFGTEDADTLAAGAGDDTLHGEAGDDSLMGEAGADSLDGGAGADTLDGGEGDDILRLAPEDRVTGGAGADVFRLDGTPDASGSPPVVTDFEPGVDHLVIEIDGTTEPPRIGIDSTSHAGMTLVSADGVAVAMLQGTEALSLSDILLDTGDALLPATAEEAADGTDAEEPPEAPPATPVAPTNPEEPDGPTDPQSDPMLDGGTPDDLLRARVEMADQLGPVTGDALTGSFGDDTLTGGAGQDALFGNEGNDSLSGAAGADEIYGDTGDDTLAGGDGTDFLSGGDGNDALDGGDGGDMLFGGDGDDALAGGAGDDRLQGGFGADTLSGGAGNDTLDGTFGTDGATGLRDTDASDTLDGGAGDDAILIGAGDTATGGDGADSFLVGSHLLTGTGAEGAATAAVGQVTDFDPTQDRIEVLYNPEADPDPRITVEDFADGTGAHILFDGQVILNVTGGLGLAPAAITLRAVTVSAAPDPA